MSAVFPYSGYAGRVLRVDLTSGKLSPEPLPVSACRDFLGGAGLGGYYLFREVAPGVEAHSPENRVIIMTGPLVGTEIDGSVTTSLVSVSALSNGAVTTQFNGTFGRKLKAAGYDGVILQGASPRWVYLHIGAPGEVELRDATPLLGKDTYETEQALRQQYGDTAPQRKAATVSVACIGPAGENRVRFAGCYSCSGHSASKGGMGSVWGAKRLKAIAIGPCREDGDLVSVADGAKFQEVLETWRFWQRRRGMGAHVAVHGWFGLTFQNEVLGIPPIKNLTSAEFEKWYANYREEHIRSLFEATPDQCPTCDFNHCHRWVFKGGRYRGMVADEIEYDTVAAFGPNLGITDPEETVYLSQVADRLGLEFSETTFTLGLLMECYEKGLITERDLDGEHLRWGDGAAVERLMRQIAYRQGCGDRFSGGVWRTALSIGGQAPELAVVNKKGHTPQVHDNRTAMLFHFGEVVSEVGHYQAMVFLKLPGRHIAALQPSEGLGLPEDIRSRSMFEVAPQVLPTYMFTTQLHDFLGTCVGHSLGQTLQTLTDALNAVTGLGLSPEQVLQTGRRFLNLMRVFNLSRGLDARTDDTTAKLKLPSGRQPYPDEAFGKYLPDWRRRYYQEMGWGRRGVPLRRTLRRLGLEYAIERLPRPS